MSYYALSRVTADGVQTNFTFSFPYISSDYIVVSEDGVETTAFTLLSSTVVQMDSAPSDGTIVEIKRRTPLDNAVITFQDGSVFGEDDLNLEATFNLHVDQEAADRVTDAIGVNSVGQIDAQSRTIVNVADPVNPSDAATKAYVDAGGGGGSGGGTSDHGSLSGLADDDHPQYLTDARSDAKHYTKGQVDTQLATKSNTGHSHSINDVTGLQEEINTKQDTLVSGTNIKTVNNQSILGTGNVEVASGGGSWDLPSIKTDHSGVGDGTTNDTVPITNAITSGVETFIPEGTFLGTSISPADITIPIQGVGQIKDSAGNKRGKIFNYVTTAPSSEGVEDSVETAFNGDMSRVPIAIEHRLIGSDIAGTPASGYRYVPELSPSYTYLHSTAGHNESTSANEGRTGLAAHQVKIMQKGQGDLVAFNFSAYVDSVKPGATSFLANPAIVGINGSMGSNVDGAYFNPLEFDLNDNGHDVAAVGTVINMTRSVGTASLGETWIGHRVQSLGSTNIDSGFSLSGKAKIGLDFTNATFEATERAICMKSGQKMFLNSTSSNGFYANNSGSEFLNWDGSKINIAVANQAILQVQSSNVIIAPNGAGRFRVQSSDVSAVSDFMVSSSLGGSNYFRARAAEVNCSVQLKVNQTLDIYNPILSGSAGGFYTYLQIKVAGAWKKIPVYHLA